MEYLCTYGARHKCSALLLKDCVCVFSPFHFSRLFHHFYAFREASKFQCVHEFAFHCQSICFQQRLLELPGLQKSVGCHMNTIVAIVCNDTFYSSIWNVKGRSYRHHFFVVRHVSGHVEQKNVWNSEINRIADRLRRDVFTLLWGWAGEIWKLVILGLILDNCKN